MRSKHLLLPALLIATTVWLLGGIASAQQKADGGGASSKVPDKSDRRVATETRTYNVADLFRPTRNYPFQSALIPPTQIGPTADEQLLQEAARGGGGGGGGGGGAENPLFGAQGAKKAEPATEGIDGLIKLIQDFVDPPSWRDAGGSVGAVRQFGSLLIVTQTEENHRQIQSLIDGIRKEVGPARMVTVRADWVLVGPDELRGLLKPAAGNESAREVGSRVGSREVDPAALEKLAGQTVHIRASVTGFNGQTVHVTSGRGHTVVTGVEPTVGTGVGLYGLRTAIVQAGAVLQLTPAVTADGKNAVLDVRSVVSDWDTPGAPIRAPAPATSQPAAIEEGRLVTAVASDAPAVDRLNVLAQQLRTTLRVPLGKPVLVGGMTLEPTPKTPDSKQLYLVVEVTTSE
jgi:hypothetical protein